MDATVRFHPLAIPAIITRAKGISKWLARTPTSKLTVIDPYDSLFAGSDEGGVSWSSWASLIETCKLKRRQSADLHH